MVGDQQQLEFVDRCGPDAEEPLVLIAVARFQELEIFLGLDTSAMTLRSSRRPRAMTLVAVAEVLGRFDAGDEAPSIFSLYMYPPELMRLRRERMAGLHGQKSEGRPP